MIHVDMKQCDLCGTCSGVCKVDAIFIERDIIRVDRERCVACCACIQVCPVGAVADDAEE